ncbi:WXG100 family type VII secretion target [Mycobacterium frederiksbergense]|uniref:ESX-1 secretion-associated protein n=1 Tax=Mycolicibacterium frederiksbergense TaxID=117567 RepID=UPI0021F3B440|nr:ESX-1 secretion-associated protein [Mycolicibacterium frederiksbergense]MCV7044986.1 WXG100 family type VII secretion target [Mycolicibacterium frederiksbergense]
MTQGDVSVVTAEVRRSADQMSVVAGEASSSRAAVADSVSTQGAGWKEKGTPGFGKFIDVLEAQAERLRTDLTALGDALRAAADVYDQHDQEAGGALDSAVRYR